MNVSIIKLTKYSTDKNGNIVLTGAMSPVLGAKEVMKHIFPKLQLTQLYRIRFKDSKICTTWEDADIHPVKPDILALELSCRYIAIYADLGDKRIPITLDFRKEPIELTKNYENFKWIKKATREDFQKVCDKIAEKFKDSLKEAKETQKGKKTKKA